MFDRLPFTSTTGSPSDLANLDYKWSPGVMPSEPGDHRHMFDRGGTGHLEDDMGLAEAYKHRSGLFQDDRTLYIAGTKSLGDFRDDLLLPMHRTKQTVRYKAAQKYLIDHPNIDTLVGHSLGGSVALELQYQNDQAKQHMRRAGVSGRTADITPMYGNIAVHDLHSRVYGAPAVSIFGSKGQRYRHPYDPVSMFDLGAETTSDVSGGWNPHSIYGFEDAERSV